MEYAGDLFPHHQTGAAPGQAVMGAFHYGRLMTLPCQEDRGEQAADGTTDNTHT